MLELRHQLKIRVYLSNDTWLHNMHEIVDTGATVSPFCNPVVTLASVLTSDQAPSPDPPPSCCLFWVPSGVL